MQIFEWNQSTAAPNLRKHCVSLEEAASVLNDVLAYTFADLGHSLGQAVNEALLGLLALTEQTARLTGRAKRSPRKRAAA